MAPGELDRLMTLGGGLYVAGRLDEAAVAYARAVALAPADPRPLYSLAMIDIRAARLSAARTRLLKVVRLDPRMARAWRNLAAVSQDLGDWPTTIDALSSARRLEPADADLGFALAAALVIMGRNDEAVAVFRELTANPVHRLRALARLGILRAGEIGSADLQEMTQAAADSRREATIRAALMFAIGGAHELAGRDDAAFDAFAAGNRIERERLSRAAPGHRPDDLVIAHAASAAHVRNLFDADFLNTHQGQGDVSVSPIFIVGMPRSGSTLIEQILSSHRDVVGLGELGALPRLAEQAYPARPGGAFMPSIEELSRLYLEGARARGWDGRQRFVDKTLENWLHVGLITLMFPRAVILHARRDPVDTAFACFRQLFAREAETLYALDDIAAECVTCLSTIRRFAELMPGRIVDVRLEDLAGDPERSIPWLVSEACGLPWDPACATWWRTERPVHTASATQVRAPMQTSGLGRWRRYATRLEPLVAALQAELRHDRT